MAGLAEMLMKGDPGTKRVYLIRHGSTALNSEDGGGDRIRGWKDVPLSEKGIKQAEKLGTSLKDSGISVLYHSPFSRATDTAKAISETTKAPLVSTDKLKPWNMGILTGQESKDVHPIMREYAVDKPDTPIPEGESFNSFKSRTMDGIQEILQKTNGELPGLVTHHRVERLVKSWIKNGQPPDGQLDMDEMLKHGSGTGSAEIVRLNQQNAGNSRNNPELVRYLLNATR